MAQCVYCKAETSLYENGFPICPECCDKKAARQRKARETAMDDIVKRSLASKPTRSPESDNNQGA